MMRQIKYRALFALLLTVAIGIAFLIPLPWSSEDRMIGHITSWLHFPAFAVMVGVWIWLLGRPRTVGHPLLLVLGVVALALAVEWIQPAFGRSRNLLDAVQGMLGGWLVLNGFVCHRWPASVRMAMSGLVLAVSLLPMLFTSLDRAQASAEFPVLSSFRTPMEMGRWSASGCVIQRVPNTKLTGGYGLQITLQEGEPWPGIFMRDFPGDWRDAYTLCVVVYLVGDEPVSGHIRIDDQPGNPRYTERFQTEINLEAGLNRICVEREAFSLTAGGRQMDLAHIVTWGLFFDVKNAGRTLLLDTAYLKGPEPQATSRGSGN